MAISIIEGYRLPYVLLEQVQFKNSQIGLWGGGSELSSQKNPGLSKKEIISSINAYCEKNRNKSMLEELMKVAEYFYKVHDVKEYATLKDIDYDKIFSILTILRCDDEKMMRRIHCLLSNLVN